MIATITNSPVPRDDAALVMGQKLSRFAATVSLQQTSIQLDEATERILAKYSLLFECVRLLSKKTPAANTAMGRVHRLAFSSILTLLPLGNVAALHIDPPLPANVTSLEPVPFTWFRDSDDPQEFGFFKIQLVGRDRGPSDFLPVKDAEDKDSGSFTLVFTTPSPFLVIAVDRNDHKSTFFTAPGTLVVLSSAITTTLDLSPSSDETRTKPISTTSNVLSSTTPITTLSSASNNRASSSRRTTTIPQATTTSSSPPIAQHHQNSKKGAIIGGVIGGVAGLIVVIASIFFLLRQRRKRAHQKNLETTPYFETDSATSTDTRDRKVQIIGLQRDQLERQLEAFERTRSPNDNVTEVGTVLDGVNDAVQALRCQIELLTDRMARLEGERTERLPPDYSSA